MGKLKLMTILGTRPEIIKCCDQFIDAAVAMIGIPAADNMDGSASIKAVKPIQSNAGIVDRFVWRKNL